MISRLSSCLLYALVGVEDGRVTMASSERYVCHLFSLASSGYSLLFLYFPSFCWKIKEGLVNNWRGNHREWWCPWKSCCDSSRSINSDSWTELQRYLTYLAYLPLAHILELAAEVCPMSVFPCCPPSYQTLALLHSRMHKSVCCMHVRCSLSAATFH